MADTIHSSRIRCAWIWLTLAMVWPRVALSLPVHLRAVETSAALVGQPLAETLDGVMSTNNGWSVGEGRFRDQFAVFAPARPLSAAVCQLQFFFLSGLTNAHFSDFEIDVTTDEQPSIKGRWLPLIPELAVANCPDGVRTFGTVVRIETQCPVSVVTLRARVPYAGITGFRLWLFPSSPDPSGKRAPAIGSSPEGTFLLTELRVETNPERSSNIAMGRQIYCSRGVAPGLPSRNLTDGFVSTYSYPDPKGGEDRQFFELDLGRMTPLDHIVLRGREDGQATDQLGAYRIETFAESETSWQTQWEGRLRMDGSRLPRGDADVIRALDGAGTFSGRRIRIHDETRQSPCLQISEVEVYPALFPRAQDWLADDRVLNSGAEVAVTAGARQLRFRVVCGAFGELSETLNYRWRLSGWKDAWQEAGTDGRVEISPAPPAGLFKLELQARHSDGVWDESGAPVTLRIAFPWWHNPTALAVMGTVVLVLAAAIWWRVKALVMKRRLAVAEQHLDLHRERLRIARDMHDEMGARLTYIALLADRTRREVDARPAERDHLLTDIAESARKSVTALDAIVWAVNPQHDTVGDLADYLSDYAPGYLKAAGIECRLDLHVETPQQSLGLTLRHSLMMAVKEALQNVVRHAGATMVRLTLRESHGQLEILVADDGRGFSDPPTGVNHSGLDNMRQRMAETGGVCEIGDVANGHGTRVRFAMPLKPVK